MSKQPVDPSWFDVLHQVGLREHLRWLAPLSISTERIVNYGCWGGSEPFALLWALDATDVKIVEINEKYRANFQEELERVAACIPSSLLGRSLEFILGDMSSPVQAFSDNSFDLSYCQDVLYNLYPDLSKLQAAINEMVRILRPGGYAIAVESKIGAEMKEEEMDFWGTKTRIHVRVSDPIDIADYFARAGGERIILENSPEWSYCYRKL